jgi:hypothetical protein
MPTPSMSSVPGMSGVRMPTPPRLPGGGFPTPQFRAPLQPPAAPRLGRFLTAGVSLVSVAAIAVTGWLWWSDRDPGSGTAKPSNAAVQGISPELREFAADWPMNDCRSLASPPGGQAERLDCTVAGDPPIGVFFIRYGPDTTLRDKRRGSVERTQAKLPRGYRRGIGIGPGGRRGPYIEYRQAEGAGFVAGLWWDDSLSRPDGATALNLKTSIGQSERDATRRLRDAWLELGYTFEPS